MFPRPISRTDTICSGVMCESKVRLECVIICVESFYCGFKCAYLQTAEIIQGLKPDESISIPLCRENADLDLERVTSLSCPLLCVPFPCQLVPFTTVLLLSFLENPARCHNRSIKLHRPNACARYHRGLQTYSREDIIVLRNRLLVRFRQLNTG